MHPTVPGLDFLEANANMRDMRKRKQKENFLEPNKEKSSSGVRLVMYFL